MFLFLGEDFIKALDCASETARDYSFLKLYRGVNDQSAAFGTSNTQKSETLGHKLIYVRLKYFYIYFSVLVLNLICESVSLLYA